MDTTVIIAIIISTIVALAIVALVVVLFYYHWRNQELLVNFSAFIRENLKLKDEVDRLQDENDELDKAAGGSFPEPDFHIPQDPDRRFYKDPTIYHDKE